MLPETSRREGALTVFMTTDDAAGIFHVRYVGFDHINGLRAFHFDVLGQGRAPRRCTIQADLRLFPQHGVAVQEGPALCARKLSFTLANSGTETHELTAEDLCNPSLRGPTEQQLESGKAKSRRSKCRLASVAEGDRPMAPSLVFSARDTTA
jgi:hypothetical protein